MEQCRQKSISLALFGLVFAVETCPASSRCSQGSLSEPDDRRGDPCRQAVLTSFLSFHCYHVVNKLYSLCETGVHWKPPP